MLNKEEREAIAERVDKITFNKGSIYEALLGPDLSNCRTLKDEFEALVDKIIDLCDTSNMVELPLDKDGEVFRVGDTVYDKDDRECKVGGYYYNNGTCKIIVLYGQNGCYMNVYPSEITHKKPATNKSLASDIKRIANQGQVDRKVYEELFRIAWKLESLGGSDD